MKNAIEFIQQLAYFSCHSTFYLIYLMHPTGYNSIFYIEHLLALEGAFFILEADTHHLVPYTHLCV